MEYNEFLDNKISKVMRGGMKETPELSSFLFPHQEHTVDFALKCGRSAAFLDTGLGKTAVELEYGRNIVEHTNKPVLMLAPLAVSIQHKREADKFDIDARIAADSSDIKGAGLYVTNYEKLHKFDPNDFNGVILDESSIIKSFAGVTTRRISEFAQKMEWRLAASATPAPNDHMELGQHSQFLGAMASNEMLARWFIADQSQMGKYRLKKHGVKNFWSWVASWARCIGKPSDVGFSDDGYILPKLHEITHVVETDITQDSGDMLFRTPDISATGIHREKRLTSKNRAEKIAEIVRNEPDEAWMIWVETDYDADSIMALLPDAVEVRGNMKPEVKEQRLNAFSTGDIRVLVSKPSIAGYGLNWQHCARTAFVGLSFSYEMYYQAIRRFYRFGQKREVHAHIAMADTESTIWDTIKRKMRDHETMKVEMFEAMKREVLNKGVKDPYSPIKTATLPNWMK
jgi:superfamily II DNA or RNA helicase